MQAFIVNSKDLFNKKKNPKLSLSVKDILKNKKIKKVSIMRGLDILYNEHHPKPKKNLFKICPCGAKFKISKSDKCKPCRAI